MRITVIILNIIIGIMVLILFITDDFISSIIYFKTEVKKDFIKITKIIRENIYIEINNQEIN